MSYEIKKQEFYGALLFLARVSETAIVYAEVKVNVLTMSIFVDGIIASVDIAITWPSEYYGCEFKFDLKVMLVVSGNNMDSRIRSPSTLYLNCAGIFWENEVTPTHIDYDPSSCNYVRWHKQYQNVASLDPLIPGWNYNCYDVSEKPKLNPTTSVDIPSQTIEKMFEKTCFPRYKELKIVISNNKVTFSIDEKEITVISMCKCAISRHNLVAVVNDRMARNLAFISRQDGFCLGVTDASIVFSCKKMMISVPANAVPSVTTDAQPSNKDIYCLLSVNRQLLTQRLTSCVEYSPSKLVTISFINNSLFVENNGNVYEIFINTGSFVVKPFKTNIDQVDIVKALDSMRSEMVFLGVSNTALYLKEEQDAHTIDCIESEVSICLEH